MDRETIEKELAKRVNLEKCKNGYFIKWKDNAPNIDTDLYEDDMSKGSGSELKGEKPKFASIASSSALAVNTFALWKPDKNKSENLKRLEIMGMKDFEHLKFERKFKNGIGTPPNLDVALTNDSTVLAIECKFLEPFGTKKAEFKNAYIKTDSRKKSKWNDLKNEIINGKVEFKHLDAAQLIKHFYGIAHDKDNNGKEKILMYLYWSPEEKNIKESKAHKQHMEELELFKKKVNGDEQVKFIAMSYQELWKQWDDNHKTPQEIKEQLKWIRNRYAL